MGYPQVTTGFNTEMVIHDLDGLGWLKKPPYAWLHGRCLQDSRTCVVEAGEHGLRHARILPATNPGLQLHGRALHGVCCSHTTCNRVQYGADLHFTSQLTSVWGCLAKLQRLMLPAGKGMRASWPLSKICNLQINKNIFAALKSLFGWSHTWHSFWHTSAIWKYIWHNYRYTFSDILSDIPSDICSDILSDILSGILTFFLASIQAFILAFYLASILTFFLASLLAF